MCLGCLFSFCFFKQKTAYEMRISDWSSDVCSSDLGWGRLIFGQTFSDHAGIETALRDERLGRRDIALYMRDPHILVSRRPQDLFVDPSFTYRSTSTRTGPRATPSPGS